MGESSFRNHFGTARGRHLKGSRRIPRSIRQRTRYVFSGISFLYKKRLSIYNWNPGPRRGREGAIEKQIARKWHIITLQEAIEYVDHELITNRFHVTHYGGCAVLFNKDAFFPDVKVNSIYLHDMRRVLPDKVVEGGSCWVIQGVLSSASFRRQPLSGQRSFTVMSFHINNNFTKSVALERR